MLDHLGGEARGFLVPDRARGTVVKLWPMAPLPLATVNKQCSLEMNDKTSCT